MIKPSSEIRMNLPNYKNTAWATKHFKEFANLPTEYKSYVGWRRLPFKGETINIDDNGLRVTPQSEKVNDTSKLVAFLGGSTMWGTGSNDINTIPAQFAALANGTYRVLNLAETSYNAFQGYLFLKIKTIEGLKPDIIVCYDGINEITALDLAVKPFSHIRERQINEAMQGMDRNEVMSFRYFFIRPLKIFIDKLKMLVRLKQGNKKTFGNDNKMESERVKQVASGLLESWQSSKDLADKIGAEFIGILQPTIYLGHPKKDYLHIDENVGPKFQALYAEIARMLNEPKYRDLSKGIVDLTAAFDGNEHIYIDNMHVSPNGNKIIAEKILNRIINNRKND